MKRLWSNNVRNCRKIVTYMLICVTRLYVSFFVANTLSKIGKLDLWKNATKKTQWNIFYLTIQILFSRDHTNLHDCRLTQNKCQKYFNHVNLDCSVIYVRSRNNVSTIFLQSQIRSATGTTKIKLQVDRAMVTR